MTHRLGTPSALKEEIIDIISDAIYRRGVDRQQDQELTVIAIMLDELDVKKTDQTVIMDTLKQVRKNVVEIILSPNPSKNAK